MTADIVVVMKNRLNPAYGGALVGARKAAARFGLTLADTAPALADDVEEQRALMAETIAARPKAIVLLPAHESRLNEAVGAAHAAGIPVFVIVSKPTAAEWITYVGSEHVGMAHDLAAYLFDRLGDAGNIVVMDGHPDSIATPERHEGFIRAAHERPGMTILESVCGWFLREPAREATRAVLQRHARIDGMLVANDLMAMGVLEALAETGRRLPVVSINGTPEAVTAIKAGTLLATASFNTLAFGALAVEAAGRHLRGETVPRELILPPPIIDLGNCRQWDLPYEARPVPSWEAALAAAEPTGPSPRLPR